MLPESGKPSVPSWGIPHAVWPLVGAGFLIQFIMMGGMVDTISVFLNAISQAEGWSRSSLSAGITLAAASAALATPLVGVAVDRWGVRRPMALGLGLSAAGFITLVGMTEPWHWLVAQMFLGTGFACCALLPVTVAVTVCVRERTTLALGIVAAGASLGTLVLAPVLQAGIDALGWRLTYVGLGSTVLLSVLPCLLFALPRGRLPRGTIASPTSNASPASLDLHAVLHRPGLLALVVVMLIPAVVSFGVHVHLVPYLVSLGHDATLAAGALGFTVGISALGKLAGGYLGDRLGAVRTFCLALGLELIGLIALGLARTPLWLGVFIASHGLAMGTRVAVIPVIAIRILGRERFATLYGLLQLCTTLGAAAAPLIPALIYDHTGNYTWAVGFWVSAIALGLLVALLGIQSTPERD